MGCSSAGKAAPDDPDLTRILSAWPVLPDHIKQAVITLIRSVSEDPK